MYGVKVASDVRTLGQGTTALCALARRSKEDFRLGFWVLGYGVVSGNPLSVTAGVKPKERMEIVIRK